MTRLHAKLYMGLRVRKESKMPVRFLLDHRIGGDTVH